MTPGRIALVFAIVAPLLIVAGLLVPDPWAGTTNRTVSYALLLCGLGAAAIAIVAAPLGLMRSSEKGNTRSAKGALIVLGIALLFFGLILWMAVSVASQ